MFYEGDFTLISFAWHCHKKLHKKKYKNAQKKKKKSGILYASNMPQICHCPGGPLPTPLWHIWGISLRVTMGSNPGVCTHFFSIFPAYASFMPLFASFMPHLCLIYASFMPLFACRSDALYIRLRGDLHILICSTCIWTLLFFYASFMPQICHFVAPTTGQKFAKSPRKTGIYGAYATLT